MMAGMSTILAALGMVAAVQLAVTTASMPAALAPVPMRTSHAFAASAPIGFLRFCAKNPEECPSDVQGSGQVSISDPLRTDYWALAFAQGGSQLAPGALTNSPVRGEERWATGESDMSAEAPPLSSDAATMRLVKQINHRVNLKIRPETDIATYGVSDFWTLPIATGVGKGDCEDFVLEKRRSLRRAGVSLGALSIALVSTRSGIVHAVLLVNTEEGVVVLDNLSDGVRDLSKVPYTVVVRQAFGAPLEWVAPR